MCCYTAIYDALEKLATHNTTWKIKTETKV